MSRRYQYIKMEKRRYFCLQQNPVILAWVLFAHTDTTLPFKHSHYLNLINKYFAYYREFKRKLRILVRFIKNQIKTNGNIPLIELPVYGQTCIPVHKGYKVFDLKRGRVIKLFQRDVERTIIESEVKRLETIKPIDFAPSLKRWSFEAKWYEEDYVSGLLDYSNEPRNSSNLLKKFYRDVIPCLEGLIAFKPTIIKNVNVYSNEILRLFEVGEESKQNHNGGNENKIRNFITSTVKRLCNLGDKDIFLVFSHGDFCPANIINTRNKIRLLDWESTEYRSILFDFYSYFFFRTVHQNLTVEELVFEISQALPNYLSRISAKVPSLLENFELYDEAYRWLYYVERISMLVERERTDILLNVMQYILDFIDAFNLYEEILSREKN